MKNPWTDQEIALAKELFEAAQASGTLKPRRVLAVSAGRSGGPTRTTWGSEVSWRDYLRNARKILANRKPQPLSK